MGSSTSCSSDCRNAKEIKYVRNEGENDEGKEETQRVTFVSMRVYRLS